jgi:hypothetical protein
MLEKWCGGRDYPTHEREGERVCGRQPYLVNDLPATWERCCEVWNEIEGKKRETRSDTSEGMNTAGAVR